MLNHWKCFSWNLLLFKVSEAINHETQIQMKPALVALELLITKTQENAFQGNYFSSWVQSDRLGLLGLLGCLQTQTTKHLMTRCLAASSVKAAEHSPAFTLRGKSWLKNVYVGNKDLLLFLAHDSQMLLLEYHLSLNPQSTENVIWNIFAEDHKDNGERYRFLRMHLTASTAPF